MPEIPEHVSDRYLATLVRGECHYLRDIRFDHGIPTVILAHHKEHLEEHAIEVVGDDDGEVMVKDKFTFKPYTGTLDIGATIGISEEVRGNRDPGMVERLIAFDAKETARLQRVAADAPPAPPFDAEARRTAIEENSRKVNDEDPALPRARPRSHAPRRA